MLHAGNAEGSTAGPIPTLTGIKLLASVVWYRSKAGIKNLFKRDRSETPAPRLYSGGLPQELLETIIAYVQFDTQTLKACSRTCRSWYIATLPHLHHTLTLRRKRLDRARGGLAPLQKLDKMRLLPFVKRLHIRHCYTVPVLPLEIFNARCLAYFSTLTNIQELGLDSLDLRSFIPQAQLYLGHFMSRVRSLTLMAPYGPHRLLLYLLGLFPNLDDFKLVYNLRQDLALPDPAPVPPLAPLLRGRLTLARFSGEDFLRDLSGLSGGLRFRYMDLLEVEGLRFLLDSGAETLETLRIHPTRWTGSRRSILQTFDLSKNRSLRSLEIEIPLSDVGRLCYKMGCLRDLLSTVTSPVFSEVVIILPDNIIHDATFLYHAVFRAVRDMYDVKPFRLFFWLEKCHRDRDDWERLKGVIGAQAARGGLGPLLHPPVIISYTRVTQHVESVEHLDGGGVR